MDFKVVDYRNREIKYGSTVIVGTEESERGFVTKITEPDGDVDDEGREYGIPPKVVVMFSDQPEDTDTYYTSWETGTGTYRDPVFVCDDLEVVDD